MRDGVHIRLTLTRGVKIHQRHGPAAQPVGADADRAGRVQAAGLRQIRASAHHVDIPSPRAGRARPKIHHNNLLNSILAKIQANAAGADDALMLDSRGFVAETNATHVFIVKDGKLSTSRVVACPEGITRSTVLELCLQVDIACAERDITLDEVYNSDEMFCTGTMGELAPVIEVDARRIGRGEPGPMYQRLSAAFAQKTNPKAPSWLNAGVVAVLGVRARRVRVWTARGWRCPSPPEVPSRIDRASTT